MMNQFSDSVSVSASVSAYVRESIIVSSSGEVVALFFCPRYRSTPCKMVSNNR